MSLLPVCDYPLLHILPTHLRTLVQILAEEKSALSSAKTLLRLQAEGRREEGGGGRGKGKGRERERQAKAKKKRVATTPLPVSISLSDIR